MSDNRTISYRQSQRGAAIPMLAFSLALFMVLGLLIVGIGAEASKRTRAQSAADAVALAGAAGGKGEAGRMAQKYGANLLTFSIDGSTVSVVLLLDGIRSYAHAERHLVATGGG